MLEYLKIAGGDLIYTLLFEIILVVQVRHHLTSILAMSCCHLHSQAKVLGFAVPDVGWLLALVFRAWIFALYAFEYTWINAGLVVDRIIVQIIIAFYD